MALVLAVSLLPTYAFAASVPTSTTIEVIKLDLEPYGYTLDMNYAIVVKTNGEVCQNWLAGENVMTLTVKLGDYQKLGWSGDWLCADGHL